MKIEIKRSGMSLGFFSEEEVERGIEIGKFIESDKWTYEGSEEWLLLSDFVKAKAHGVSPGFSLVPWEDESQDVLPRFFLTVKDVLLDPGSTFSSVKGDTGYLKPLIFACVGTLLGVLVGIGYQLLLRYWFHTMPLEQSARFLESGAFTIAFVVFIIVFMPLGIFLGAGLDHLMLFIVGGARKGFQTTFSVFSYSTGSTTLLSVIPICGATIGGIWNMAARAIGYSKSHQISGARATIAVLLPMILCCACLLALVFIGISLLGHDTLRQAFPNGMMT